MNPRLRRPLIIIGAITIIVIAFFVIPRGLSLYYQIRGGQQIEYVMRFEEGMRELVCEPLSSTNEDARSEVELGIADLNRAIKLNKNNSQAYYYLGKAYCLLGEPNNAKENYMQYTILRPDNPLGYLGLGFAYGQLGNSSAAKNAWKTAGLMQEDLFKLGDKEFEAGRYNDAIRWYEWAEFLNGSKSKSRQFIWAVAEILSGKTSLEKVDSSILPVVSVGNAVQIEGETLIWFNPNQGSVVEAYTSGDTIAGGLWWTGCALTAVQFDDSRDYQITIRAQHLPPSPILLEIQKDFKLIAIFSLEKEDMSWEELEVNSFINKGIKLLSICFLNDGEIENVDRNLLIDWIRIKGE